MLAANFFFSLPYKLKRHLLYRFAEKFTTLLFRRRLLRAAIRKRLEFLKIILTPLTGDNFAAKYSWTQMFKMEFEANVRYGDGEACFRIFRENPGVYYAELLYVEGGVNKFPVKDLTLVRGIRHWAGSSDDSHLHNKLGKVIESFLQKFHTHERGQ